MTWRSRNCISLQVIALKDEKTEDEVNSINDDHDLPPYPEISFTSDLGIT